MSATRCSLPAVTVNSAYRVFGIGCPVKGGGRLLRRWEFPAAARDQRGRQHDAPSRPVVSVEPGEQQFCGVATEPEGVLCNDGDCGLDRFGERHIVEAD